MTVKDLIEKLSRLNPDFQVVLSRDEEGNRFSPLNKLTTGQYEPDTDYKGEFYESQLVRNNDEMGEIEIPQEQHNTVCLWPSC